MKKKERHPIEENGRGERKEEKKKREPPQTMQA
jgi:hypothetical protein